GRPDVLGRVEVPSALGAWSYEVVDTKLAPETRAGTILQLALYSDLLKDAQGRLPERFHVVTPEGGLKTLPYRVLDSAAYARLVREAAAGPLPRAVPGPPAGGGATPPPLPAPPPAPPPPPRREAARGVRAPSPRGQARPLPRARPRL